MRNFINIYSTKDKNIFDKVNISTENNSLEKYNMYNEVQDLLLLTYAIIKRSKLLFDSFKIICKEDIIKSYMLIAKYYIDKKNQQKILINDEVLCSIKTILVINKDKNNFIMNTKELDINEDNLNNIYIVNIDRILEKYNELENLYLIKNILSIINYNEIKYYSINLEGYIKLINIYSIKCKSIEERIFNYTYGKDNVFLNSCNYEIINNINNNGNNNTNLSTYNNLKSKEIIKFENDIIFNEKSNMSESNMIYKINSEAEIEQLLFNLLVNEIFYKKIAMIRYKNTINISKIILNFFIDTNNQNPVNFER